ncbi:MAG: oligosaccharide flippase family protein [Butyrivibrio sp.]|uniref:oligosaccharide flippase family protein n=1 Tax=Butyrivibrio sp. TaxID=28121 RepID=UPI0025C28655|nr:oligosaccharide flippase family protein [Butyrivibrio sp.]MBQ6587373.1 oligosaccharide flippase family protein [Butyrivibrio sp.]
MDRKTIAVKGAGIGVASQLVNLVAKFVVRTFAIRYLGMELLGLDSVLIDIVSMLSLAEMGLTSAMLFRLYKPIIDDDKKRVSVLMASYRMIYHIIAAVITVLGIIIFFFLPYIVKNISITWEQIYFAYVLQLICSISSYILAYQRILLNADQKKHLCLLVDMIATVIFSALKVFVIVLLHSYLFYLVLNIFQIIIANIVLKIYSFRTYSYIDSKEKCDKADLRVILNDTKEVLGGKIAGYIYSGTDNMIISIVLGTGIVGILSNYKYISSAMKGIVNSTMSTIQPLIGNYLNSDATKSSSFRTLLRYTFIRYLIAGISTCAFTTISDSFVQIWAKSDAVVM